jgi:hypothetical protein
VPFVHPVQLAIALALGTALTLRGWDRARTSLAAGRLSFILGVAWIIAGGWKRWYPQGDAIAAVASWALSGWLCGVIAWTLVSGLRARAFPAGSNSDRGPDGSS